MEDSYSDDDLPDVQHSSMLHNTSVAYGKKFQRIQPPSRYEPSLEISEFHLVSKKKKDGLVKDLMSSLDKTGKYAQVSQKVKKVQKFIKPLPAPLEKPEAEKVKRTVAFNETKSLLNRWDPIVSANRVADQLSFPLNVPFFNMTSSKTFLQNPRGKTPLEKEVESILSSLSGKKMEEETDDTSKKTFFLNRKEIMQQRRELARLRAQQSYRESKARQQNKIKSKKYHRILRRERTKKQLKEFEELMKVDPEAALKKLEELENTRAEERLTLRHRSTGQWARNRAVHAKYDKQSREMLAKQLRLGKELTQKIHVSDSSDGEEVMAEDNVLTNDESNPWMKKGSDDYQEFITGYRKFWGDQLKSKTENNTQGSTGESHVSKVINNDLESPVEGVSESENVSAKEGVKCNSLKSITKFGFIVSDMKENSVGLKRDSPGKRVNCDWVCTVLEKSNRDGETRETKKGNKKCKRKVEGATEKPVYGDLDDIFEEMEVSLKSKAHKKISSLKSDISTELLLEKDEPFGTRKEKKSGSTSSQEKKVSQNIIDETASSLETSTKNKLTATARTPLDLCSKIFPEVKSNVNLEIDPKKFISIDASKPVKSGIPSITEFGDDDNDDSGAVNNCITIAAAFTEDDVVTEFQQEKEAIIEENKPKDVDLTLPGWGEWAGKGIPEGSRRKKKRFILKVTQQIPRKDDKKDSVIINENADDKARSHQVNELPYPYVGVESFEASIRAPIGSTWIPEIAHEKLTTPKVSTLQGAVIEPLTEDALLDEAEIKKGFNQDEFVPEEL